MRLASTDGLVDAHHVDLGIADKVGQGSPIVTRAFSYEVGLPITIPLLTP